MYILKRTIYLVLALILFPFILSLPGSALWFSDVTGHDYEEWVLFLSDRAIVKWYPDGTYGVDQSITRAELLKIILEWVGALSLYTGDWQVQLEGPEHLKNCFPDVTTQWYAPYVCYAKENWIAKWYPDGTFKPNNNVTIAEALKMTLNTFEVGAIEWSWQQRAVPFFDFVHNNNIFSKYALIQYDLFNRGEMAHLVHLLLLNKEWTKKFTGVRDASSPWCFAAKPASAPTEIIVDGVARHYITAIGSSYSQTKPAPLIIAFHGRTNSNAQVQWYYGIEKASAGNAIVVYPLGLPEGWPTRSWMDWWDKNYALRDFALFDELVEKFSNEYCIDMDQIYVIGHSLGWWFTNTLWCARGDVIRGVWSVWGSVTKNTCSGPVQALIMHNPKDNLASFAGGVAARDLFLAQNSCDINTATPYSWAPETGNCVQYSCQDGAPVVWCEHSDSIDWWNVYYPHLWPKYAWGLIRDFWNKNK